MKNMNFKVIAIVVAGLIVLILGGNLLSGNSDKQGSSASSVSSSNNTDDLLVEACVNKLVQAIYNNDFELYLDLLDESSNKTYMNSSSEQQKEYQEKFNSINVELKSVYGEYSPESIVLDDISYIDYIGVTLASIEIYFEDEFLYDLSLQKENGRYVLRSGLSQLDDLLYIY